MLSTVTGYVVGVLVTADCTASTFGIGAVPGIALGTASGFGTSFAITKISSLIEDKIWGKSK
jgi:hypothetical protein